MPSFLDDTANSPIYHHHHHHHHDNPDILDLDPHNQLGPAAIKDAKVDAPSIQDHRPHSTAVHEPFDETSNSSINESDTSDPAPMTSNGDYTRPTSMSSLPNGKAISGGYHADQVDNAADSQDAPRLPVNGVTSLPDRTAPRQPHPGVDANSNANVRGRIDAADKGSSTSQPNDATLNSSSSIGPSPADRTPRRSHEHSKPPLQTIPSESLPPSQSFLSPASPTTDHTPPKSSPQRLSSPPVYHGSTSNSSSVNHLHPPHPGSTLKQRHTLEVPKLAPGRPSLDAAQSSGRFSPTAAASTARRASLSLARRTTRSMQSDAPRDEVVPDEDAQRWAEAYRQKRASKRRRKEEEDDERVLVGTKVDESHANWVTAYNMLTGIRVSVSRTNAKLDREVTDEDFNVKQKSTFDIAGNELVPSAKYDFKFKDYAPWVFRDLRARFRLDPADYLMSLTGKYILSELGSPGKSGSFFYFSRDYKYIIKTIHHAEHKFLRKILKEYYEHVKDNPNTLLSQFYGLHRVKVPYGKKIHFVVMNNLFPPHRDIHTTFDLKGSTIGRDYKEDDLDKNPRATLKDLNWLRRHRHLEFGLQKKRLFLEQLQRDVVLLKRLQIMDYSLLVGIHDLSRGNEENLRDKTLQVFNPGGEKSTDDEPQSVLLRTPSKLENARKARELRQMIRSEKPVPIGHSLDRIQDELEEGKGRRGFVFNQDDGGFQATHEDGSPAEEIYYLGVIDCLTHYGMIKKIEHFWKGLTNDKTQISALPPEQYGDRFYNFVEGVTMSAEEAHRDAQRRDEEMTEAARNSHQRKSHHGHHGHHGIPPMPDHQPPAPPTGHRSPEAREIAERAEREARRTEQRGASEKQVPDRTLRTVPAPDQRDPSQHEPILPIVEEAGEAGDKRPKTPAKDRLPPPTRAPPPTPPKGRPAPEKPESADSGYGGPIRLSRESLRNKSLPPLPNEETADSGVKMVA